MSGQHLRPPAATSRSKRTPVLESTCPHHSRPGIGWTTRLARNPVQPASTTEPAQTWTDHAIPPCQLDRHKAHKEQHDRYQRREQPHPQRPIPSRFQHKDEQLRHKPCKKSHPPEDCMPAYRRHHHRIEHEDERKTARDDLEPFTNPKPLIANHSRAAVKIRYRRFAMSETMDQYTHQLM